MIILNGEPYINLAITVLKGAKRAETRMWSEFKASHDMSQKNWDALDVASWVGNWINRDYHKDDFGGY